MEQVERVTAMTTCIPETSYFATPEFLSLTLHCMSVIEIPIHLFGAWIIIYYTPVTMSSVKWPLLNMHFWSSFLDISISFFTIPFVLFPAIAGYPLGFLSRFGWAVGAQGHAIVLLISVVTVSMVNVYENRYFLLSRNNRLWQRFRTVYCPMTYFIASSYMFPFSIMIPEQSEAIRAVFRNLPCLPQYVYEGPVFVYTLNFTPVLLTITSLLILAVTSIVIFISLTVRNLLETTRKNSASGKTLNLQKKFLFGLVIQTTIPILVVFTPCLYLIVSLPQGYYNQAANNFFFITLSLHGILSTLSMLLMHQPYRRATFSIIFPCCILEDNTIMVPMKNTTRI